MRPALCAAPRRPLRIEALPDPAPAADGVVPRRIAGGLCRSDGQLGTGADPAPPPVLPGREFCREVVTAGPEARCWRAGAERAAFDAPGPPGIAVVSDVDP